MEDGVKLLLRHFPKTEPALVGDAIRRAINRDEWPRDCFLLVRSKEDAEEMRVYCTHCGREGVMPFDRDLVFKHNEQGTCPKCGEVGPILFSRWFRHDSIKEFSGYVETFHQSADDDGVIGIGTRFRWVMMPKTGEVKILRGPVEYWYFNNGHAEQWRRRYSWMFPESWKKRKSACRGQRHIHAVSGSGYLQMPLPYMVCLDKGFLGQGAFKFCPFKEYLEAEGFHDELVPAFLELYAKYPKIVELLMKCNLGNVVAAYLQYKHGIDDTWAIDPEGMCDDDFEQITAAEYACFVPWAIQVKINWRAKSHKRIFQGVQLTKDDWKYLTGRARTTREIGLLLRLKKQEPAKGLEELSKGLDMEYVCAGFDIETGSILDRFTSWRQGLMYLTEQQKCWKHSWDKRLGNVATEYRDYMGYVERLKLDVRDTAVTKPHNLKRAHDNLVKQWTAAKDKVLDAKIAKTAAKIKNLAYVSGGLLIRPAAGQKELVAEGKALTHCVATYADSYADGETFILFIRKKNKPDVPFYTVEISRNFTVLQVRGDHNKGATQRVQDFVKVYKQKVLLPLARAARRKGRKKV